MSEIYLLGLCAKLWCYKNVPCWNRGRFSQNQLQKHCVTLKIRFPSWSRVQWEGDIFLISSHQSRSTFLCFKWNGISANNSPVVHVGLFAFMLRDNSVVDLRMNSHECKDKLFELPDKKRRKGITLCVQMTSFHAADEAVSQMVSWSNDIALHCLIRVSNAISKHFYLVLLEYFELFFCVSAILLT